MNIENKINNNIYYPYKKRRKIITNSNYKMKLETDTKVNVIKFEG